MNEAYSFTIGMLTIHMSIIITWGVMLLIIGIAWLATRQMDILPSPLQTVIEGIFEVIEQAILEVAPVHGREIMPFIATLWLFLVIANLVGLIPGLHSPTGDLSVTSALALLVFLSVHWFGIRTQGIKNYLHHYLQPTPILLPFHIISELTRTLALAIRLFGNIMSLEMAAMLIFLYFRYAGANLSGRRNAIPAIKFTGIIMTDITMIVLGSTIAAVLGIAIGVLGPALAMGKAINSALEALARQPEAERSIMRTLFIGLAMIESLAIYCLVIILIVLFKNPLLAYIVN